MTDFIQWFATAATIIAASMTASNLGTRVTGTGFAIFLAGSIAWVAAGIITGQPALLWTNVVLSGLNLFGIWRWLGRQADVEKGGRQAARASARDDAPTLFPVSLLTSAKLMGDGRTLGQCVDAMAGRDDGRLRYLVVSDAGLTGVGETLRRLDWSDAEVEGDRIRAVLKGSSFEALDEVERDQWPGR